MSTVAILMPGDMGHGVGQSLISQGHRAISPLQGRSEHTRSLVARAGIEDAGDIDGAVAEADLILSILPPDRAVPQAEAVAASMASTGKTPAYVDCNAISPMTMQKVADSLSGTGCQIIDCGIIGLNPIKTPPTRFYVSGPDCSAIEAIGHDALRVTKISDNVGAASALKMVYAAGTKGVWTLQTALLLNHCWTSLPTPNPARFRRCADACRSCQPTARAGCPRWRRLPTPSQPLVSQTGSIAAQPTSSGFWHSHRSRMKPGKRWTRRALWKKRWRPTPR